MNFSKVIFNHRKSSARACAAHAKHVPRASAFRSAVTERPRIAASGNDAVRAKIRLSFINESDFQTKGKWYFVSDFSECEINSTISLESNGSLEEISDFDFDFEEEFEAETRDSSGDGSDSDYSVEKTAQ